MGTSHGRTIQVFHFLFCINLFLLSPLIILGQKSFLQQAVSISVSDKPVADVLDKLSNICGVRFTYDPDDISAGKRISLDVKNMPLAGVLSKTFGDNSIKFREKGAQVIIFRDRSEKETPFAGSLVQKPEITTDKDQIKPGESKDKEQKTSRNALKMSPGESKTSLPDTLYIIRRDTILKFDTLLQVDTLVLHDTVFLKREEILKDENTGKKDWGFFAEVSGSYILSKMILSSSRAEDEILATKLGTTGITNLPGYSAGLGVGYHIKGWSLHSGLYYTRYFQTFTYSYGHQTGGYFETDTIEKYYTLSGPDTSWFYITDSTWLEKQIHQYNYKQQNQFRYIEIPFSVSYAFYHRNFDIYLSGGVIAGILPSFSGSFINPTTPDFPVSPLKEISLNTFILSVTGGAGTRFSLNDRIGMLAEVFYRQQLRSIYKSYPVSVKFGSVSFRFGLTYNF
jgi:hypothetical protein